ncbi:DNA/RNA non-specific endonuclease [Acetobacter fallax]|uniref:DNA/RNA non-specific endonuclease n=1 Tax=Acetobacter fallax TaxID=1737473 RepID=A0ABX0KCA9_9PROT|nr:DNA/RNA non-specific endonuclease [Acetobacter fallax]NHO32696.1 DNA/RNA non-specific endonuclease [Acetobacter fallax]NHO36244.1 DNA/RNA non-specific endonuclease [Acetobacter fallax]
MLRFCLLPLLIFSTVASHAACPDHFVGQTQPATSASVILLCSTSYAAGYSAQDHEAAWSAEHLTRDNITRSEQLQGRGSFHEDLRLPPGERSEPCDYKRSGWSRGHLTPSGDAPTRAAREETFAFSNIVPQAARLNSSGWNHIEANIRKLVKRKGEVFVVTGPAFREPMGTIGPDHVRVPSSLWKAVYIPTMNAVAVVVCKNTAPYRCNAVSPESLERVTGINPFPSLPDGKTIRSPELDRSLIH